MFFALAAGGLAALYFYRSDTLHGKMSHLTGQVATERSQQDVDICARQCEPNNELPVNELPAIENTECAHDHTECDTDPDTQPDQLVIIQDYESTFEPSLTSNEPHLAHNATTIRVPTIRLRTQM
jgi:hypothetical protein